MPNQFSRSLSYLYFLRFSLMLWLFPVLFAVLDSGKLSISTTTLSRGIFVPEYWSGYLCVSFFVIATGFAALITARTVVINGMERFAYEGPKCADQVLKESDPQCLQQKETVYSPPDWLWRLLAGDSHIGELRAVVVAQLPALLTLLYLVGCGQFEGVPLCRILSGVFLGILLAGLFAYVVNALYYLAYQPPHAPEPNEPLALGKNAARTILLPRKCFGLRSPGSGEPAVSENKTLEDITTALHQGGFVAVLERCVAFLNKRWRLVGYVYDNNRLYEAQLFSWFAAIGYTLLFWVIWPLTAPRVTRWAVLAFLALVAFVFRIVLVVRSGKCEGDAKIVRRWKFWLTLSPVFFAASILVLWSRTHPDRFPTLASILLMAIVLGWVFSGLAFFLDRFRVPVLTFALVFVFAARLPHRGGFEEHYVSTVPLAETAVKLPTPAEILDWHLSVSNASNDQRPYVVITATGGGLHASAWTARVLHQIYLALDKEDRKVFANHLLLLSTVSGGSVGASYYLEAVHEARADLARGAIWDGQHNASQKDIDDAPELDYLNKMTVAAQCSSLEAVGWGLVYYDFVRALAPGFPWLFGPSSGDRDLDGTPLLKDRTWTLRKSIERNYDDPYCYDAVDTGQDVRQPLSPSLRRPKEYRPYEQLFSSSGATRTNRLTIGQLPASENFPAFAMNSTTAEGGDRFLLANYRLPSYTLGPIEGLPAESFLDLFCKKQLRPDLPLSSAAQLSATFPYVSSAARVPVQYSVTSAHFVDGGYYDDDGTVSAIEFLRYALIEPLGSTCRDPLSNARDEEPIPCLAMRKIKHRDDGRLHVLLIEIRNSKDIDAPGRSVTAKALNPGQQQDPNPHPAGMLQQFGFPLEGFWNAGHVSVTGRDRNGLDLLRRALADRLEIRQVIFDDESEAGHRWYINGANDPLSWSLTPKERAEVANSASARRLDNCYAVVTASFHKFANPTTPETTRCPGKSGP